MAKVPKKYLELASRLYAEQRDLKIKQKRYEEISRVHYELPKPLDEWEWIRPFRSLIPYNSLRGATRALSNRVESLSIHPITVSKIVDNQDSKAARLKANEWEQTLKWQLAQAGQRYMDLRAGLVYSSALYGEVVIELIHLPTEFKARGVEGWRMDAAYRYGDWAAKIHNPQMAYVDYSHLMPEATMLLSSKSGLDVRRRWGDVDVEDDKDYVEYDIVNEDGRVVFVTEGKKPELEGEEDIGDLGGKPQLLMGPEPWLKNNEGDQVPFLPLVCSIGGSSVELDPEHARKPMFYPVVQSEQWAMANIAGTLAYSQSITMASQPKGVLAGPEADSISVDFTDPTHLIRIKNPQTTYTQLRSQGLDVALKEILDRHEGSLRETLVADVLVTGRPLSGEQAASSFNLQVQMAIASLGDIREIAQDGMAKLYQQMLLIAHYTGSDITAYAASGDRYVIDSEDIDPFSIQLEVELRTDVPADRLQRVNSGATLIQVFGWSRKDAAEYLGESDPEGIFQRSKLEQIEIADLQAQLQRMQAERSGQYERDVMAAAQMLLQQQQQQQQQQMEQFEQQQAQQQQFGEAGLPGGQQNNPAVGGAIPIEAAGELATFEGATGTTRGGGELATI